MHFLFNVQGTRTVVTQFAAGLAISYLCQLVPCSQHKAPVSLNSLTFYPSLVGVLDNRNVADSTVTSLTLWILSARHIGVMISP